MLMHNYYYMYMYVIENAITLKFVSESYSINTVSNLRNTNIESIINLFQ